MRFANVLGWKREDGSRIPVTAAGLKEHKALVAKYEKENGPLRSAYRAVIDRKYARVKKKLAEREVGRAKSKGRADTEKRRAMRSPSAFTSGSMPTARKSHPRQPVSKRHKALCRSCSTRTDVRCCRLPYSIMKARAADVQVHPRQHRVRKSVRRVQQAKRSKVVASEQKAGRRQATGQEPRGEKASATTSEHRQFRKFVIGEIGREGRVTTAPGFNWQNGGSPMASEKDRHAVMTTHGWNPKPGSFSPTRAYGQGTRPGQGTARYLQEESSRLRIQASGPSAHDMGFVDHLVIKWFEVATVLWVPMVGSLSVGLDIFATEHRCTSRRTSRKHRG